MRLTSILTLCMSIMLVVVGTSAYADDPSATSSGSSTASPAPGAPPTAGGSQLTYLYQIANYTYGTLSAINNVPNYLNTITQMAISWLTMETDGTSFISQSQSDFTSIGSAYANELTTQSALMPQTAATYLGVTDLTKVPNVNNMFYSSLIGMPPLPISNNAPFSPATYLANALGTNIPHAVPQQGWTGTTINKTIYSGYYTTIISANSFGAYVLNGLVAENQNGSQLKSLQNDLITKASQSSWLAQIATEELGKVMRDILLFQSQNYVLMTKLVDLQKQTLVAQVMTNSLLVATNQGNEPKILSDALGITK